ncbi:MAG: heme exporter protein CcmB [Hyphomicrobiales bacterium]|nr:heme exporter protein CcmB [Hyphomicrobiales bacterium]
MSAFFHLIARDVGLGLRDGGALGAAIGFHIIVVATLPLGLGPDLNLLSRIAPGVLWISLLLAALLSAERIFQADFDDGSLEQLALGPLPLELAALAKAVAHWLSTAAPLIAVSPALGLLLNMDASAYGPLLLAMLAGTPAVSFLGVAGAALTCGLRRGGLLLGLILLPLYVPVLIFGVAAVNAAMGLGGSFAAPFSLLCAFSLATAVLGPIAAAAALRGALN